MTDEHINKLISEKIIVKEKFSPEIKISFYRLILVSGKTGNVILNKKNYDFNPPFVLSLNDSDKINFKNINKEDIIALYFHPGIINSKLSFYNISNKSEIGDSTDVLDADGFLPFYERNENNTGIFKITNNFYKRIFELIKSIDDEVKGHDKFRICRSRSYLIELIFLIFDLYSNSTIKLKYPNSEINDEINGITNYIAENFNRKITIPFLVKKFNTNKNSLNIKFRKYTGLSVVEYIAHIRISIAQSMLKETTLPVSEIVYKVGYSELNYFGKIFKRLTGYSPSEYRNKF